MNSEEVSAACKAMPPDQWTLKVGIKVGAVMAPKDIKYEVIEILDENKDLAICRVRML